MLNAYAELKNKNPDFSLNLYGNNVGEKIYTEIKNLIH